MLFDDLTCSWIECQRAGTATEKVREPASILIMGTDNKRKPDEKLGKAWRLDTKVHQKKEFDRQWYNGEPMK